MDISLILFLNICLLLVTVFPYAPMYLKFKDVANYGQTFMTSFFFVAVFFGYLHTDFWKIFFINIKWQDIIISILGSIVSISLELLIMFLKFKQITVMKVKSDNTGILLLLLLFIPCLEEICYIGFLNILCDSFRFPSIVFLLISSIAFGVAHIIYHKINIVTKSVWGIIFVLEFLFTNNIYVPIISHVLNNIFLYLFGRRNRK